MSSSTETGRGSEIRIPRETVNDDFVIVAGWNVQNGNRVRPGDSLVDIETSKSIIEIAADAEGYVQVIHPAGAEVPVGELIGRILPEPVSAQSSPAAATVPSRKDASLGYTISKKAQRLVEEHAIDPSAFAGRGLIREADVIKYLEERVEGKAAVQPGAAPGTAGGPEAAPAPSAKPWKRLGLLGDARIATQQRGQSMLWLLWNYFWNNWFLGNLASVAPRGVTELVHRARGVKMGRDCFVDPSAILETAYPENVTLGDDVRVTAGAVIMTHIKAPQYLRATGIMPMVLKPVVLRDHCFIGVNAVVMPGVTVGKAAVVASGSVVVADVPAYTLVAGNPAKVMKRFPKPAAEE